MKKTEKYLLNFRNLLFLLCLTWLGVFTQNTFSQNRNTITGFVFDSQRNPITQQPVELMNEVDQIIQRTRTDGSGRYFFSGLSSGKFSIKVLSFGSNFEEQTQEVEIINFVRRGSSTSENAQKDFYLKLRQPRINSITGTLFVQEVPSEAQKSYEKAIASLENNNVENGIAELLSAVKIFPDYFIALERLGREYIKRQEYEYAQATFLKAVSVNNRSFMSWYGLSYSYYGLKEFEKAIEAAQNASKLDSSSVEAILILGISLRQANKFLDSEKSLLQAKKLAKDQFPDVHWNLALLYAYNLKKYNEAANELELYLKINSDKSKEPSIKKLIAQLREKSVKQTSK